ncbi:MAG TPA: acyl-CoA dehydrogenase family protein [Acidimicrobiales bacterium]|nr:acyl-CoA dehydrogenase family protein [Acidimicrobiales bacterium]
MAEEVQPSAAETALTDEVRTWIRDHWDPEMTMAAWWEALADSGWGVPTWPKEWFGRDLPGDLAAIVTREMRAAKVPGVPAGLGSMLAGPTIVAHGNDEVKQRYLREIVNGQKGWCQLFSEPGAGSDLASLQTRAVRDGDEWVVNGQKVWTSGAHVADLGMLLARTDPDAPKHKGITYFAIDMDQPGVEVRPLREMTGRAMFNEVFLTDARVRHDDIIGDLNQGWGVALTTLANERVGLGGGGGHTSGVPGKKGGMLERKAGEVASSGGGARGAGMAMAMGGGAGGMLGALAKAHGRDTDPVVRQKVAALHSVNEIMRYTGLRAKSASAQGRRPGPEVSTGKLNVSRTTRASRELGLQILGAHGMLDGADAPVNGAIQAMAIFSPAVSIYGGSDEIQRNIIGERVLGLPKEPSNDNDVPFRELRVGTQRKPADPA